MSSSSDVNVPAAAAAVLRCPQCGAALATDGDGGRCERGHSFPWRDGYLDLSPPSTDDATARTMESFGYEWQTFDAIQPEDEEFWRWYVADVDLDALSGTLAVDAGCGKGRYTLFTARHVGTMVALDGSEAAAAAVRNLGTMDNTVVVRGDLREPPLEPGRFGFVSCLGVLHHLPDPEAGFHALARLLAPGGRFLVYVYSRPDHGGVRAAGLAAAASLRRVTVRLPHRLLRAVCAPLAGLLYAGVVVPGAVGQRRGIERLRDLPLQTYRGKPVRSLWLDTFDRLSAPLEARYTWADLAPWYERAGLEVEAVRDDAGLFVVARRP
jgi:SAM-dependent methyltransferase